MKLWGFIAVLGGLAILAERYSLVSLIAGASLLVGGFSSLLLPRKLYLAVTMFFSLGAALGLYHVAIERHRLLLSVAWTCSMFLLIRASILSRHVEAKHLLPNHRNASSETN
jgi:hypothetical protein